MNLVWFKITDLRLRDHEALKKALNKTPQVLLIFCLDPRFYQNMKFGEKKFSNYKLKFLYQSLIDLYKQIKANQGHLNIYFDTPESVIPELVKKYSVKKIFHLKDTTDEELKQLEEIKEKLSQEIIVKEYWGNTVYHIDDLPYSIDKIPFIFSNFRKSLDIKKIREEQNLKLIRLQKSILDVDNIDKLIELDKKINVPVKFIGGETQAWERLNYYFYQKKLLSNYKTTRNGLLGKDYSSKFSPYLAFGNISGKSIQLEIFKYETEIEKNVSTYWLYFELIWRDFFRFSSIKYGNSMFKLNGIRNKKLDWRDNELEETKKLFNKWKYGETGYPYVDANMIELRKTGFMSNRGRQMVASFLIKDLKIDWRMGAEYFESMLIDYDVASNYGNWNYAAGIGADPRENRYFSVYKQAYTYDRACKFILNWIPELKGQNKKDIINVKNLRYYHPIVKIKNYNEN
jgi:deoxyribodipyrimidine photo-lyase